MQQCVDTGASVTHQIGELHDGKWHDVTVGQVSLQVVAKIFQDAAGGLGFFGGHGHIRGHGDLRLDQQSCRRQDVVRRPFDDHGLTVREVVRDGLHFGGHGGIFAQKAQGSFAPQSIQVTLDHALVTSHDACLLAL